MDTAYRHADPQEPGGLNVCRGHPGRGGAALPHTGWPEGGRERDELELRNGKQVVSDVTTTTITAAKLGPNFEDAFFRDAQPDK